MTSHSGFVWPREGLVVAPDWDPTPECGHGLHGLLDGEGDGSLLSWMHAVWLVAEIDEWVDLNGKVKAPCARVVHCGNQASATAWLVARCPGKAVVGATVTAGYRGIATTGGHSTATAGYCGTATAGYNGTATAGEGGIATAGDYGTATAGYCGTATAGDRGTATAGEGGTATAGHDGTATAGCCGTATAGDYGTIIIAWWDGARRRLAVGYVGEGIDAGVAYRCEKGQLVKAT